jgi:hypothetical protein
MLPRKTSLALVLVLVALLVVLAISCHKNGKPGADTTPPFTTADPPGGTYGLAQSVTLKSNETATVYYTTDGREPTVIDCDGTGPSPLSEIEISTDSTLKFFAVDAAGNVETVRIQTYILDNGPDVRAPITAVDPPGGIYNPPVSVTLMPDEPAAVYYTTDGSTPDNGSTVYESPISISENTTLKFFGVDTAENVEDVKTEVYEITGGGDPPSITSITPDWGDTGIICVVPAQAETGDVTVTTGAGTSNGVLFTVTGDPNWQYLDSITYKNAVLAGKRFTVEFNDTGESLSITEEGTGALTSKAQDAVARAPAWVRAALVETLAGMSDADQNTNADKILGASEPYVDEWSYIAAHQVGGEPPLIDEIAQHLLYVQVVNYGAPGTDPEYYTTLKYALKDVSSGQAVWIELPRDIYYMQLVAHSGSNMRSLFFSANYGDPAIKNSVGKDAAYPGKYVCMTNWANDDGTFECAFRGDWKGNGVPTSISPLHTYPMPGVG